MSDSHDDVQCTKNQRLHGALSSHHRDSVPKQTNHNKKPKPLPPALRRVAMRNKMPPASIAAALRSYETSIEQWSHFLSKADQHRWYRIKRRELDGKTEAGRYRWPTWLNQDFAARAAIMRLAQQYQQHTHRPIGVSYDPVHGLSGPFVRLCRGFLVSDVSAYGTELVLV